jgi:anti-anti-sigma factor
MTSLSRTPAHRRGPPASLLISREGGHTVVWLVGDQDLATLSVLETALTEVLELDQGHLVVDLRESPFVDAGTIGALIRSRTAFRQQSRNLTVRAPSAFVRRVLGLCGVAHLVDPSPAPT